MTFLIILLALVCVVLAFFVLIQNPKGGGLATGNSGTNMFGVQRTGDVLEKGTWVLLALVVVLSLSITVMAKSGSGGGPESKIQNNVDKAPVQAPIGGGNKQAPAAQDTTKK